MPNERIQKGIQTDSKQVIRKKNSIPFEGDWIYPLKKNIKVSDHPVEICFLIRIMNTIDPERFIEDEVIIHDMPQMAKVLREEKNVNAVELAEHLEMYIGVGEMTEEDFIKIFSL